MTYKELCKLVEKGKLKRHHSAYARGYVSRKTNPDEREVIPYQGRYGKGYVIYSPCYTSSWYCWKTYYIEV